MSYIFELRKVNNILRYFTMKTIGCRSGSEDNDPFLHRYIALQHFRGEISELTFSMSESVSIDPLFLYYCC